MTARDPADSPRPSERDYSHRDVVDKLGVRPAAAVAIAAEAGALPSDLVERVRSRAGRAPAEGEPLDVVLLAVDAGTDLTALLRRWRPRLAPPGGIWLLSPKRGRPGWIDRSAVIAAGLAAGLVDNKICSIDDGMGAIRFVVPKARRGRGEPPRAAPTADLREDPTTLDLDAYVRAAPKVELHVHLEGAIRPATLLELARRNGVALPATDLAGLRRWFAYRDFAHFVEIYVAITRCLRTAADYELIAHELGAELARQHVRYAEVTFTPASHDVRGVPQDDWFGGLTRGRQRARAEFGVELAWVFDLPRSMVAREPGLGDYTVAVAVEGMADGVVALGLGGIEAGFPPEPFAPWFARAGAAGLGRVPHAGETVGPESVRGALAALGADRIGHGVRAIEDPAVVAELAARRVPLEVCPTSNLRLGVYPDYAAHPLPRLLAAGVELTVNSDDPPLFNTTLNDEYALLPAVFGLDLGQIDRLILNGVRHSFLPAGRKRELEAAFAAELAGLKRSLGRGVPPATHR